MGVEVVFRGPSLFLRDAATLRGVLVPDCEKRRVSTHPDGTNAKPHYSRMQVFDAGNQHVQRVNLHGMDVTISDGTSQTCDAPSLAELVDFALIRDDPSGGAGASLQLLMDPHRWTSSDLSGFTQEFRDRVATTTRVEGGTIDSRRTPLTVWNVPQHPGRAVAAPQKRLAIQATWRSTSERATITIRNRTTARESQVVLDASRPRACLYNFDVEWPSLGALNGDEEPPGQGDVVDQDFKWLYQLFNAPQGGWSAWLAGRLELPAPSVTLPQNRGMGTSRNPGSAGCFGAFLDI